MAKKAKKEILLTPEEKLAQALVPEADQPYRVPENWCWVKWGEVGEFIAGNGFKNEYQGFTDYEIPFYKVGSLKYSDANGMIFDNSNTINEEIRAKLKASLIPPYSVLFAKIGEAIRLNRRSVNEIACCIDNNMMAFVPKCLKRYAFYWSCGIDLYDYTNATTVPAIRKSDLEIIPFPLAPYAEQQRIVDRIESLFAKLDEAKEKARAVVDGFENRKAAILHKAFTGELTAEWRKKNKLLANEWVDIPLEDVCSSIYDGDHMPPPKSENGIPFLVISNVNTGYLSFEDTRFVPQEYYDSLSVTRKPEIGDVLYTLVGSYGIPVVVNDSRSFCFQRHMALLKPSKVNPYFLWYQLQGQEFYNKATEIATGTAQLTVPIKGLRKLSISLPSESEQAEVVRILDDLFSKKQKVKKTAKQVIDQIDVMKKSILARAFRGELGTNDLADESAEELLKRIL